MELTQEYFEQYLTDKLSSLPSKEDFNALKVTVEEIKETVERIDKRDFEDSTAFASDIVKLQKEVKQLKLKHAG